jgi:hypothetical protein
MDLRKATSFLMAGLIYMLCHKTLFAVASSLQFDRSVRVVTMLLWVLATATLPLFAFFFLKELSPPEKLLRWSLILIMVCTGVAVIERLPIPLPRPSPVPERLLGDVVRFINGGAILGFVLGLRRRLPAGDRLARPLQLILWGAGVGILLGLFSIGFSIVFLLTGNVPAVSARFQPLAIATFLLTYGASLWFLALFRKVEDYPALLSGSALHPQGESHAAR